MKFREWIMGIVLLILLIQAFKMNTTIEDLKVQNIMVYDQTRRLEDSIQFIKKVTVLNHHM